CTSVADSRSHGSTGAPALPATERRPAAAGEPSVDPAALDRSVASELAAPDPAPTRACALVGAPSSSPHPVARSSTAATSPWTHQRANPVTGRMGPQHAAVEGSWVVPRI